MSARPLLLGLGVAAPPAAWFATQQAAGAVTYFACEAAGPAALAIALAGLAACLAAGALSWRGLHGAPPETGRFAARLGLGLAGVFALTNAVTLAAACLIPSCAR